MVRERRQYARLVPDSPISVRLGRSTGLLSNLSEGGLAVKSRLPEIHGGVFPLDVELPNSDYPLHTLAHISWASDSQTETGVEFVQLPAISRQQLREWISAQSGESKKQFRPVSQQAPKASALNLPTLDSQSSFANEFAESAAAKRRIEWGGLAGLVFIAATLWAGFFSVGLYVGSSSEYQWIRRFFHESESVDHAAVKPAVPSLPATAKTQLPPSDLPDIPGYVLQVAAMANEDNADALAETLQKNGFPAFVFKHVNDRLFKVAVGSYADTDSAAEVKRKLEKQGFEAILRHWSPE